jgi:hypothetical protein
MNNRSSKRARALVMHAILFASMPFFLLAQDPKPVTNPVKPPSRREIYLESWQGQPGKPDQTAHGPVGPASTIDCIEVSPIQEGSQCKLKYESGETATLDYRQSIKPNRNEVVYLTCNATVPTRSCKVRITNPKK